MRQIKWSVYEGSRHIDSGSYLAEKDSDVLKRVLLRDLGSFEPVPEKCYRVSVGGSTASTYGDEFERTAYAIGDDLMPGEAPIEEMALSGGHLYEPPPNPCREYDLVTGDGSGEALPEYPGDDFLTDGMLPRAVADADRAREEREVARQIETLVNSAVIHPDEGRRLLRGFAGGATLPEINPTDLDGACYGPDDHRLMEYHDPAQSWTTWECSRCGRCYRMADEQLTHFPLGTADLEQTVRRALG